MRFVSLMFVVIPVVAFILVQVLRAFPAMQELYANSETSFQKLKSMAWNSLTIAWSYLVAAVGVLFQGIDAISALLGDPNLKDQITSAVGDAQTVGRILLGISIVTIVARLRSIGRPA